MQVGVQVLVPLPQICFYISVPRIGVELGGQSGYIASNNLETPMFLLVITTLCPTHILVCTLNIFDKSTPAVPVHPLAKSANE